MARIRVSTTIDAAPAVVWEDLRHIDRHVEWMRDAVSIAFTSEQAEGVGTAFTCLTRVGPFRTSDRMVVTQWAEGAAMGIRHEGAVTGQGRFTLEPDGDGTRFTWAEELRFPWWMGGALGATVAAPVLKLVWRRNLRDLKGRFA
ncbi:MAG TPA: SRPBCC family protein [Acidimicrobiales bacterium]|nr:SRPBCC family protein [Acidimicrobiales bacterium]